MDNNHTVALDIRGDFVELLPQENGSIKLIAGGAVLTIAKGVQRICLDVRQDPPRQEHLVGIWTIEDSEVKKDEPSK